MTDDTMCDDDQSGADAAEASDQWHVARTAVYGAALALTVSGYRPLQSLIPVPREVSDIDFVEVGGLLLRDPPVPLPDVSDVLVSGFVVASNRMSSTIISFTMILSIQRE